MEKNAEIVIRRCGNGFMVAPNDYARNGATDLSSILVFNELGYGSTMSDDPRTISLLAWLTQHFSDK